MHLLNVSVALKIKGYVEEKQGGMKNGSSCNETITFDKPFMYIIRDTKTKDIWFIGKVYEPTKMEESK